MAANLEHHSLTDGASIPVTVRNTVPSGDCTFHLGQA